MRVYICVYAYESAHCVFCRVYVWNVHCESVRGEGEKRREKERESTDRNGLLMLEREREKLYIIP